MAAEFRQITERYILGTKPPLQILIVLLNKSIYCGIILVFHIENVVDIRLERQVEIH